jgi:hypothetical protein
MCIGGIPTPNDIIICVDFIFSYRYKRDVESAIRYTEDIRYTNNSTQEKYNTEVILSKCFYIKFFKLLKSVSHILSIIY